MLNINVIRKLVLFRQGYQYAFQKNNRIEAWEELKTRFKYKKINSLQEAEKVYKVDNFLNN